MIASGGKDRIIKIWDPRTSEEICSLYNHTNSILKVRYSFDGKYLLTGGRDQTVRLFDARSMKELHTYKMHDSDILCNKPKFPKNSQKKFFLRKSQIFIK